MFITTIMSTAAIMLYGLIPLFPVIYILLRWRIYKENIPLQNLPGFGFQCVLGYFTTIAAQALVLCIAFILYSILEEHVGTQIKQTAYGLAVGSAVLVIINVAIIWKSQDIDELISRTFAGVNLVLVGVMFMVVVLIFASTIFVEEPNKTLRSVSMSGMIVYGLASALFGGYLGTRDV